MYAVLQLLTETKTSTMQLYSKHQQTTNSIRFTNRFNISKDLI